MVPTAGTDTVAKHTAHVSQAEAVRTGMSEKGLELGRRTCMLVVAHMTLEDKDPERGKGVARA